MNKDMDHSEQPDNLDALRHGVAIIGMTGRFPGANNLDAYWRNIRDGVESITVFADEQLRANGADAGVLSNPNYVKARGIVDNVDLFDAGFFGYSHRDAMLMDPQQRLFLQSAWEALEAAGYDPRSYRGLIGVYGGATASSYQQFLFNNFHALGGDGLAMAIGNELPFLTTRVSYKLDLKGPSCPVQTACSTSLVAVHLACQGLLNAECDMALAGGVSLRLPQEAGYFYQDEGIVSPDGHCRSFDAKAAGTIFSNGVGIVVLKRLEDAIEDGDTVYAVIRGSSINNDGARRASFTAPGVNGQSQVIADALASAEVDPETISYLEAHGTATALGDSIEIQALTKAFAASRRGYCAIGSVKANIGHLDAAAGVAGLIKTVLALRHRQLPPTPHFERPNPDIHFEATPFYVSDKLRDWPRNGAPRRAGVSSFGFGGTNAHVIVEEAPTAEPSGPSRPVQILLQSTETPSALEKGSANLAAYLGKHDVHLADAAYTLALGRRSFKHRRAIVCRTREEALRMLDTRDPKALFSGVVEGPGRRVVFLFPGQGSQYVNMGRELYDHEPPYREIIDRCAKSLAPHLGFDLRSVLYPTAPATEELSARLKQTSVAQPALFVVEYALARLLMTAGIEPEACIGHSLGEFVAACLAGVLSEEDALRLVALRGRLMDQMPQGVMLAVPLPESRAQRLLSGDLWLAAVNHASLCVVSGSAARISALEAQLRDEAVECQRLQTSHAFHSGLMDGAVEPFVKAVASISLGTPAIPYISNVSGTWITDTEATDPKYWGRQIRDAVRFAAGASELLKKEDRVFLEVGPGNTLAALVRRQAAGKGAQLVFSTLRHAREETSDMASVASALGRLWVNGVTVDWPAYYEGESRRRVALPPYPFEGQRYWVDPAPAQTAATAKVRERADGRRPEVDSWFYAPAWQRAPLAVSAAPQAPELHETWLVLGEEHHLIDRLAKRLEGTGREVVVAGCGDRFRRVSRGSYTIDPYSRDDYQTLLKDLAGSNRMPAVVLHFHSFGAAGAGDRYEADQRRGYGTLVPLAQALADTDGASPLRLAVITSESLEVTGHETLAPGKITALGLCRVIPQEHPTVSCKYIDLDWSDAAVANLPDSAIDRLLHDASAATTESVVAYRGSHRWVQTFVPLELKEHAGVPARLRPNGVYFITGGLGDIGLHMAHFLLRTVQARVVLTGRTGIPPRAEWDRYLQRSTAHDPIAQRIARVKELEAAGGELLVLKADAGNADDMRAAFDAAERQFGPMNGVIHAAGLISGDSFRPIAEIDTAGSSRHFQPKIAGLCVLDEVIAARALDFCLLVSSLSAVLGGLRYAEYATANLFMDAFAYRRNRTSGFPWLTINWDSWMRTEDEARLAGSGTVPSGFVMTPTEGIEAFRRLLGADWGVQAIVSTGDLQARLDQWVNLDPLKSGRQAAESSVRHPRPDLQTEYIAPSTDLERALAAIWAELLCVDRVGVNDNFFDLGGDSFLGIQVISRIKKQLGVKVSAVTLYEGPRIALLAKIITAHDEPKAPVLDLSRSRGERRRERRAALEAPTPALGTTR
jgi:acyl transferase domain-containing protein